MAGQVAQALDALRPRRGVEHAQRGQQHAAQAAGHGKGAVAAGRRHQQRQGVAASLAAPGQFAVGIAGDIQEAGVIHPGAHQLHRRHALRAGATAAERHQQGRAIACQVQRGMGEQAGGVDGADLGRPLRIDGVGHHLGNEARAAGAREDHPLARLAQCLAQEAVDARLRVIEQVGQRRPQARLLGDFFGGVGAAKALPRGQVGKHRSVHSQFLLGDRTFCVFFRNVKYRKIKKSWSRHSFYESVDAGRDGCTADAALHHGFRRQEPRIQPPYRKDTPRYLSF
ncbi:hypothetical protein D3C71_1152930 [compost metagenome]